MKTQLACHNLAHNRVRTLVAVAGVSFAVVLIFVQLGFRGAVAKTSTQIYDALDFDIMLRSPSYLHLCDTRWFPQERLYQAAATDGVAVARPFYIGLSEWQNPQSFEWRGIIAMGTDPRDPAFTVPLIRAKARQLVKPEFVLMDTKTRNDFGPRNGERFTEADIGVTTSLGFRQVQIVELFELGTGLAANGAVLLNPAGYARVCAYQPSDQVSLGLIRIEDRASVEDVQRRLRAAYESLATIAHHDDTHVGDVEVLTREEALELELDRWINQTPIGQVFTVSVWVAVFIGTAIVYQVLSTDVANMMSEYATLKAMGYGNRYLTSVILQQALLLAVLGFIPSVIIAYGFYYVTGVESGLPISMPFVRLVYVFFLAVVMCVASGLGALRKLFQADPADLF